MSPEFLAHFLPDGFAGSLVDFAKGALFPVDLRMRKDPKSGSEHATLYAGLTAVLQVWRAKNDHLRLKAAAAHQRAGRFDPEWLPARSAEDWAEDWGAVELYLERIIPLATQSHGRVEGAVQAAIASYRSSERVVLDREVTPSFRDAGLKKTIMSECQDPILTALAKADLGFSGAPRRLGNECDALALDATGRVLAIEIKPLAGTSVAWVTAQAAMYARLLQAWIDRDELDVRDVLLGMAAQRHQLRLAPPMNLKLARRPRVVPVVALQRGASPEMIRRMLKVRDVLADVDLSIPPVEIFEVSLVGELLPLDEAYAVGRVHRKAGVSYAARANDRAVAWKQATATLPNEARADGEVRSRQGTPVKVAYALPRDFAELNLLPEVRHSAMELFRIKGIPWHQGVNGGPTNHLRSSQVQCVNALGQMTTDPARIMSAFGNVLDIADVRDLGEVDPSESGRLLSFEFVGPKDYLNEARGGKLTPGANCTSIDAAFAYRTSGGVNELALIEWKFTETYPSADKKADEKASVRLKRYQEALLDPDSPIRVEDLDLTDLFHEPLYQLTRQQLLAAALERDPEVAADVVRVVHVLSPDNAEYDRSFVAPSLRGHGSTVTEVWHSLLTSSDRFVKLNPAVFLDPSVTSDEYCLRYGDEGQ